MTDAKDILVEVKVRNNRIVSRMRRKGVPSVSELCRQMGMTTRQTEMGLLINMKTAARKDDGEWVPLAIKLADFFQCMPEDLFSDPQQYLKLEKNRGEAEVTFAEIQYLTSRVNEPVTPEIALQAQQLRAAVGKALSSLTPREERVLRMRYGFESGEPISCEVVAEQFQVSAARIAQIEAEALRKLKHPSRTRRIRAAGFKKDHTRLERQSDGSVEEHDYFRLDEEVVKAL